MPMDRLRATELLDHLHAAQNEFYGGGSDASLREILNSEIVWTVPGTNLIAGVYRGLDAVLDYFARRRDLAGRTFQMHRRDVLPGQTNRIAALTDGTATINGRRHEWSTIGLYEIDDLDHITACWLLALDQAAFDAIWSR